MDSVHGDLLIGGLAIREVDAEIDDLDDGETCDSSDWHGRVSVTPEQRWQLEKGRLYRLELDDGRAGQIVVCDMHIENHGRELVLEFDGASSLK